MILPNHGFTDSKKLTAGQAGTPGWTSEILAYCCSYCATSAAVLAGSKRMQYPPCVRIIQTPCTCKVESEHILECFEKGIDGLLVFGCLEGSCHFVEGNLRARNRVERIRSILDEIGLKGERLKMVLVSDSMADDFVQHVQKMVAVVGSLGPNPLKTIQGTQESAGEL